MVKVVTTPEINTIVNTAKIVRTTFPVKKNTERQQSAREVRKDSAAETTSRSWTSKATQDFESMIILALAGARAFISLTNASHFSLLALTSLAAAFFETPRANRFFTHVIRPFNKSFRFDAPKSLPYLEAMAKLLSLRKFSKILPMDIALPAAFVVPCTRGKPAFTCGSFEYLHNLSMKVSWLYRTFKSSSARASRHTCSIHA
mmetsp:Transcript_131600/g.253273  ORF Transcript_131600/g.253273 Transcript_131600/m.253273 type:complete len:203 (-) Transcript_131600:260-868(-)